MCKVARQWVVREGLCVLYLDEEISRYKFYRFFKIDDTIYKPIPMSHYNGKCIAINASGDFVGKEVEFVDENI